MRTRDSSRASPSQRPTSRIPFGVGARFDRLRRRARGGPSPHQPSSSSTPRSIPLPHLPHLHRQTPQPTPSPPKSNAPAPTNRDAYIAALEARMRQMEKVPTSSFYHSYAGEFDVSFLALPPPTNSVRFAMLTLFLHSRPKDAFNRRQKGRSKPFRIRNKHQSRKRISQPIRKHSIQRAHPCQVARNSPWRQRLHQCKLCHRSRRPPWLHSHPSPAPRNHPSLLANGLRVRLPRHHHAHQGAGGLL